MGDIGLSQKFIVDFESIYALAAQTKLGGKKKKFFALFVEFHSGLLLALCF